jgi:organic radical activating enzyme
MQIKTKLHDSTTGRPVRVYENDGRFSDWSTDDFVGKKLNVFTGWSCGAGTENLFIGMDGEIHGASCRVGGQYGNIYEDFTIPASWVNCDKSVCSCGADLFIPKVKSPDLKPLLIKMNAAEVKLELRTDQDLETFVASERSFLGDRKQIYWELGRRCNYDCTYCWPWIHNNTDRHKTLEELVMATDKLVEKFGKGSQMHFIISGGEPTLNPDFLDWVRYISGLGHSLSMHSNGSRMPDYYRELIHYGDINFSAHFEHLETDRFLKVVEAVTDEKIKNNNQQVGHLEIKLMMPPGGREVAVRLRDKLLHIPNFTKLCTWAFVPIRDIKTGEEIESGYDQKDFALFGDGRLA